MRFLRASYDYFYDEQGAMVLCIPGWLNRNGSSMRCGMPSFTFEMNETILIGAINSAFLRRFP